MNEYLVQIHVCYRTEIRKLTKNVKNLLLKDVPSSYWIQEKQKRLTETTIHVMERIHKMVREHDTLLKKQDLFIRQEYNMALFQLYFSAHRWNFYGLGAGMSSAYY